MRVSYRWLKDLIDFPFSPEELADVLTKQGMTVDAQESAGVSCNNIVVGVITKVEKHPDADSLTVLTVDVGDGTDRTIVCGAPNVAEGLRVPVALVGAQLGDLKIKKAKLRGVPSEGMCCAADELGISDDHDGLLILAEETVPGTPFSEFIDDGDTVYELDIPNNRPDLLCHVGIAREIAAQMTMQGLRPAEPYSPPPISLEEADGDAAERIAVSIDDETLCPAYTAGVIEEVRLGAAPLWMQSRLHRLGLRPINNIVDITNYVLLEYGHPLHAFDANEIAGNSIIVRTAKIGEKFVTLDDVERVLDDDMLLICDGEKPVALAGVMGGANSEVTDTTRSIILESAYFDGPCIRRTVKKLGLSSEASMRFERCVRGAVNSARDRAAELMCSYAGGTVLRGAAEAGTAEMPASLSCTFSGINSLLGMDVPKEKCHSLLTALGFVLEEKDEDTFIVTPPEHRVDIFCAPDIAEECARVIGYDAIPIDEEVHFHSEDGVSKLAQCREYITEILSGCGLLEAYTPSLISQELLRKTGIPADAPAAKTVDLSNASTRDQSVMRTCLYPGLVKSLQHNVAHGMSSVRLFECGRVYTENDSETPAFTEEERCCIVLWGAAEEKGWWGDGRECDFFDVARVCDTLFTRLGIRSYSRSATEHPGCHPVRTADIHCTYRGKDVHLGMIAELDPRVMREIDIPGRVVIAELSVTALSKVWQPASSYTRLPRYPSSTRDVAFFISTEKTHADVAAVIDGCKEPLLKSYRLFDLYTGEHVPEGKKSMAYRMTYRDDSATLQDKDVDAAHTRVIAELEKHLSIERR